MINILLDYKHKHLHLIFLLLPIFFLVLKSWFNIFSIILFLISIYKIFKNPYFYFYKRDRLFIILAFSLALPFMCELSVQTLRANFYPSSLDGPSRFLLGSFIFIHLSREEDILGILKFFLVGCLLGLLCTFVSLILFVDHYWGARAATYFVDPNSLPVYSGLLCCFSLYAVKNFDISWLTKNTLYIFLTLIFLYIVHISQTRTAWIPAIFLVLHFIYRSYCFKAFFLSILGILILLYLFYYYNELFKTRADNIIQALYDIRYNNFTSSSLSVRINIFLAVYELIKMEPLLGFQDGFIPSFEVLKAKSPTLDPIAYKCLKDAGSHFEITAQILRKGMFFGSVTLVALFLLPGYMFLKKLNHYTPFTSEITSMFICVMLMLFISSFGIEVFNLKMYSTFWAIFLALAYSLIYSDKGFAPNSTHY